MLRTILVYIYFFISLLIRTPLNIRLKKQNKRNKHGFAEHNKIINVHAKKWAKKQFYMSGSNLIVKGLDNIPTDEPVLYISNHQSYYDILAFLAISPVPCGFVAKKELSKIPLLSIWMKNIHCVFLDRKDLKSSMKSVIGAVNLLKSGHSMVLFPEGTRSKTGEIAPFKTGSFKIATNPKITIIPVTIDGTGSMLEWNRYKLKPRTVHMTFHKPIPTRDMQKEEQSILPQTVYDIISECLSNSHTRS